MAVRVSVRGQVPPQEILDHEILMAWMTETNGIIYQYDGWQNVGNVSGNTFAWAATLSDATLVISDKCQPIGKWPGETTYIVSDERCRELYNAVYTR